jgi:hypothetical protein
MVFLLTISAAFWPTRARALSDLHYVEFTEAPADFPVAKNGVVAPLIVDSADFPGVIRAAHDLQKDLKAVTGRAPDFLNRASEHHSLAIIVGTIGHSPIIDQLVAAGKLKVDGVAGKWESFVVETVDHPLPEIDRALVIAGSDKRGTIYGLYDLSEQSGVSPWYWWADVPIARHDDVFVKTGRYLEPEPAVKYRGIFLNDEAPSLSGWTKEKFGGYNHAFYEHVFELLLRLKGNYLWPAMWDNAFNEDDPENPRLANEWGIVMGTSHHEPMLRAQQEWKRHGTGPWDYSRNADVLKKFWTEGVRRNRAYESIITIGMRGDGDMPMSEKDNVALLEKIVADQREILRENVNPDLTKVPQLWALYKEVQGYYEKGMRVPDDVTLLWCDDNWGNIRRLPTTSERQRSGGAGIYYHFDYVGGPRNYKWINVTPITKVWEQMRLAEDYGADRIWIVNVGDLKPMEFPIEFFLTMARAPKRWPAEQLQAYTTAWATREFGPQHAAEIAELISGYTKFNRRRTPELLSPDTYSLINYNEADRVVEDYRALLSRAETLQKQLPEAMRPAFFEVVLHPIKASAIVNQLYVSVAKNRLYFEQGRASTNTWGERAKGFFQDDAALSHSYNKELLDGKWDHMMDQTHIGYTSWQQPPTNVMPATKTLEAPSGRALGLAVEGNKDAWSTRSAAKTPAALPQFDSINRGMHWIDLFRAGQDAVPFEIQTAQAWIKPSVTHGTVTDDQRVNISIDWQTAPVGEAQGTLLVKAEGKEIAIAVPIRRVVPTLLKNLRGFAESDGAISFEAENFTRAVSFGGVTWRVLPDFGRTRSGVTTEPALRDPTALSASSPHLEYSFSNWSRAPWKAILLTAPTQAFQPGRGLRCAVSVDDEAPKIVDVAPQSERAWAREVSDSVNTVPCEQLAIAPGTHVLKIWAIDPGVVLEKIELDFGGLRPSYLGPQPSRMVEKL